MCDKAAFREQGYTPRAAKDLYDQSLMIKKDKKRETKEMEFIKDTMR